MFDKSNLKSEFDLSTTKNVLRAQIVQFYKARYELNSKTEFMGIFFY